MDMREFSGSSFIKPNDLRDGPRRALIADVVQGKFDKPDMLFDDGSKMSINATNPVPSSRTMAQNPALGLPGDRASPRSGRV